MKQSFLGSLIFLISFSFLSAGVCAEDATSAPRNENGEVEMQQVVEKIGQVRKSLSSVGVPNCACDITKPFDCSFAGSCKMLNDNLNSMYIYQDADGHKVANYPLLLVLDAADACLKNSPQDLATKDPFVFPDQLISADKAGGKEQLKSNIENYNKQVQRVRGLFQDAKENIVRVLEKRRNKENSSQISSMIERVKTVQFSPAKLGANASTLSESGCEMPNAYYLQDTHQIRICPQFLNFPDATLFATLSHELGHSIDPCMMSLAFERSKQGDYSLLGMNFEDADEDELKVSKQGLPSIKLEKNPLKPVVACLESKDSIKAVTPAQTEVLDKLDQEIDESPEDSTLKRRVDLIESGYDRIKYCGFWTGSQMQEAAADWVSAQALEMKLGQIADPKKAKTFAFESQLLLMNIDCPNLAQKNKKAIADFEPKLSPRCAQFKDYKEILSAESPAKGGTHPKSADRINKIIYSNLGVQKALACNGNAKTNGKECK